MNHENEHGRKLLRMKVEFDVMQVTMEPSQAADNEALTRGTKLLRIENLYYLSSALPGQ